jgi:hypothetical protein
VLRTATGPMTGADIARAVLAANNVTDADSKAAQTLAQAIQAALRNHAGGGAAGWGSGKRPPTEAGLTVTLARCRSRNGSRGHTQFARL